MRRFIAAAICLLLIGTILPLADISQGGGGQVYAASTNARQPESPDVVYQSDASPYDGTYSGLFYYEYQEWKQSKDGKWGLGEPVKASLKLTVTFQHIDAPFTDRWILKITRIIVDDPAFGTGAKGIDLDFSNSSPGSASLPLNATSLKYPLPFGLNIDFPNGAKLSTMFPGMPVDDLKVGFAEWTLAGSRWQAGSTPKGHPLSGEWSAQNAAENRFRVTFKSWSLIKILSPGPTLRSFKADYVGWNDLVYFRKKGTADWVKFGNLETTVNPGDEIKTGTDSPATLHMPDGYTIEIGPNSQIMVPDEWAPDNYYLKLLLGKIRAWRAWLKDDYVYLEIHGRTYVDDIVLGGKGTDFTVEVDANRTITVTVLEGAVVVTDTRSNNGLTLVADQSITIPKTKGEFTQQDMLGMVKYVQPNAVDRWWAKSPVSTGEQATARQEGSLVVGKFVIMSAGTQWTPAGFLFGFTLIVAIFFLLVGQVFAFRLRRMSNRI